MKNFTSEVALHSKHLNSSYLFKKVSKIIPLVLFVFMKSSGLLYGQTQLEMAVASYPSPPSGSTVANQTATLLENSTGTTFVSYTPSINYTLSLSNQQYTGIAGISTGTGLSFGTTLNITAKTATAASVVNTLGAIGGGIDGNHTSNPNGAAGTGIVVGTNYGFRIFATVEPLYAASSLLNGRYYYGDLTISFNRPVSDPVLHVVGLGGTYVNGTTQGFTMEYELQTTGLTLTKLSGSANLNVPATNKILNASPGAISAVCGTGGACGRIKVAGTNITQLVFKLFVRGDGLGPSWSGPTAFYGEASTLSVSLNKPVTVSGTVFGDANGTNDALINGTGTNASGTLSANLVDANGNVVATAPVAANGTYSFLAIGAGSYTVRLSTSAGVQGTAAPVAALPANYINTAEGTAAAGDGTANGATAIIVGSANVTGVNFGINQLPTANNNTLLSQLNPGGTNVVAIASTNFSGTDPDAGGQINSFKFTAFPSNATSITINGTTYTSATFPVSGVTVAAVAGALPAGMVSIDPVDGLVTSIISYKTIDLAGLETAAAANVTIQFTTTLAVEFIDFAATKVNGKIVLKWNTANEVDMLKFEIEKSENALSWASFISIAAASKGSNEYSVTDTKPFDKINYYRIKQIDNDGKYSCSAVVRVVTGNEQVLNTIKISPNPVKNVTELELESDKEETKTIRVVNLVGKTMQIYNFKTTKGFNKLQLNNIEKLANGFYNIVVQNQAGVIIASARLIKQ
jgi:hypothetical protein